MSKELTVQNVVHDIAYINGLTLNQEIDLFNAVEKTINDWFKENVK